MPMGRGVIIFTLAEWMRPSPSYGSYHRAQSRSVTGSDGYSVYKIMVKRITYNSSNFIGSSDMWGFRCISTVLYTNYR